ncbi:MAG TPA: cytochrome-c oxidase, cbb3-type subunit III [Usitatibacteraceae bacterium]|nr:cytochrome-c oxidase, cbb3-type subunit III [Usitatibacteraceae bacterium]
MSDFVDGFWSLYIAGITLVSIVACALLLTLQHKRRPAGQVVDTTGHQWDEDLAEFNNPLPKWWIWLFWITIVFSLLYLVLYPGLGSFKGVLGWSSTGQYKAEQASADATYGPVFQKYAAMDIEAIAKDPKARVMGERMFLTYCSQCHGSDARGAKGFPNLADNDWLWGGEPQTILTTIMEGRNGMMPPMGAAVGGPEGVREVANYVLSLSGATHDAKLAEAGKAKFAACAACHGPEAKGNPALGAPNLTDKTWLHGGSLAAISEQIDKGRTNVMPAHKDFLGPERSRILAAYVWSLSQAPAGAK